MKTPSDVMTILYQFLKASSLATAITGEIRKDDRPAGSTKEDIVVNSLPLGSEQLQQTVANVNIYVPSLMVKENGITVEKPNYARLKALQDTALPLLKNVRVSRDYYFNWQQVSKPIWDKDSKSFYINIRIDFYAFNIN